MLWHDHGPDPMRKLFATTSKLELSARTPLTVTMLGEAKVPTHISSAALTMFVPAAFLPVTPLFHALAPQADQMWPGIIVTPPMESSVKGPLALKLRSRVNSSKTLM